jgi:hypothetical protein
MYSTGWTDEAFFVTSAAVTSVQFTPTMNLDPAMQLGLDSVDMQVNP